MQDEWIALLRESLRKLDISDGDLAFLENLALVFSGHPDVFTACHLAFLDEENEYHYHPVIGAPYEFEFDYDLAQVTISRPDGQLQLSLPLFQAFLSYVDLLFGKIYPLGSIVELDKELLPEDLVTAFAREDMDFNVVITGRRALVNNQTAYADYIGYVWPYGMDFETQPLLISNLFVKRVISEGYTDARDKYYCDEELRRAYFYDKIFSTLYPKGEIYED
ncbi:hypothetical protein SAMN05216347_10363 [Streptococcus equinus]|uniref:DUF4176 domain-containing protein n=1 Tax=Streptococcus equinus TaxID=1335 RepID=A0A1H0ND88_STREI|nr:DUF4176 domain-containing protein [Streptococcus equinus]SDO90496.1 hypothetical protein SAMN05216347_10363 [Streptococcus equinus]